jgi:general secretion pathway protein L
MKHLRIQSLAFARQALNWWLAELADMVPARLKQVLTPARSHLILAQTAEGFEIIHSSGAAMRGLGLLSTAEPLSAERLAKVIADPAMVHRLVRGNLPVMLRLPASKALFARLSLPAAVKADLPQILGFELDRRTPFSIDTAYFSYRVAADSPAGKLNVILTVVPKTVVVDALSEAARLGLKPQYVTVAAISGDEPASGNLLPAAAPRRGPLRLALRMGAAAAAAALAAALYFVWQDSEQTLAALRQEMVGLRRTVAQVEAAQAEMERLQAASAFLAERRREVLPVTRLLGELTHVLPDNTWLVQLSMSEDKLQLTGYSSAAAGLIQQVTTSAAFRAPQFRSAVMQDSAVGRERFELMLTVSGAGQP